jgi:tetratricopeptide (TPR) repeat protein
MCKIPAETAESLGEAAIDKIDKIYLLCEWEYVPSMPIRWLPGPGRASIRKEPIMKTQRVLTVWLCSLALVVLFSIAAPVAAAPRIDGLGSHHRTVTTVSAEAQHWFDQGLVMCWGFNHEAAIASFSEAARLDPDCAMAWWGIALASGPHVNNMEMDAVAVERAWTSLARARDGAANCSAVERDLIKALAERYVEDPAADRRPLDEAYAAAMRDVWQRHPGDPDVGALFAEALMDLRPWDLWSPEGEPRPETPEILETLDTVLVLSPQHPGANHFYIHTCEASPDPGRAEAAADRLRGLVTGAGHLEHMPSHIDIRLGHYQKAVVANQKGIESDLRYVRQAGHDGFYTLYRAHNYHFLTYAAMFTGQRGLAMNAARELVQEVPMEMVRAYPQYLDGFMAVPLHVMIRFGLWQELIDEPAPPKDLPVSTAFWHYARSVAYAATGEVRKSKRELRKFNKAYRRVPEDSMIGNNTARVVLEVARPFAEGELEYRRGNHDKAFALLREAVQLDDALIYDEPWGWMEPVRHALGALLLEQGRVEEAAEVYRQDLRLHPDNGWALHGLA